jgi:hypothetical protein
MNIFIDLKNESGLIRADCVCGIGAIVAGGVYHVTMTNGDKVSIDNLAYPRSNIIQLLVSMGISIR